MRVAIVTDDDMVLVDGEPHSVECSKLRAMGIHAVQWYDKDNEGEIEYKRERHGPIKMNELYKDFARFQWVVDAWKESKARDDKEKAEREAETEKLRAQIQALQR